MLKKTFSSNREREKIKLKKEERAIGIISVCSEIIKLDGSLGIIEYHRHFSPEFLSNDYEEHIRPVLYKNLHLLPQTIISIAFKIDDKIAECNFEEEIDDHNMSVLVKSYEEMILMAKRTLLNNKTFLENE